MPSISPLSRPYRLRLFAAEYVKNGFQAQKAVLSAGFTQNPASAAVIANRLLNDVKCDALIEGYMQDAKMSADEVLERLTKVARSEADVKGSDVVKANELLGKFHKLFVDKIETTDTSSRDAAEQALLKSIQSASKRDDIQPEQAAIQLFQALSDDPALCDLSTWPEQYRGAIQSYLQQSQEVTEIGDQ